MQAYSHNQPSVGYNYTHYFLSHPKCNTSHWLNGISVNKRIKFHRSNAFNVVMDRISSLSFSSFVSFSIFRLKQAGRHSLWLVKYIPQWNNIVPLTPPTMTNSRKVKNWYLGQLYMCYAGKLFKEMSKERRTSPKLKTAQFTRCDMGDDQWINLGLRADVPISNIHTQTHICTV